MGQRSSSEGASSSITFSRSLQRAGPGKVQVQLGASASGRHAAPAGRRHDSHSMQQHARAALAPPALPPAPLHPAHLNCALSSMSGSSLSGWVER